MKIAYCKPSTVIHYAMLIIEGYNNGIVNGNDEKIREIIENNDGKEPGLYSALNIVVDNEYFRTFRFTYDTCGSKALRILSGQSLTRTRFMSKDVDTKKLVIIMEFEFVVIKDVKATYYFIYYDGLIFPNCKGCGMVLGDSFLKHAKESAGQQQPNDNTKNMLTSYLCPGINHNFGRSMKFKESYFFWKK